MLFDPYGDIGDSWKLNFAAFSIKETAKMWIHPA